jgi:hypothetical protein
MSAPAYWSDILRPSVGFRHDALSPMSYRSVALTLQLLAASASFADKQHARESARGISQNLGSYATGAYDAPLGSARIAAPIYLKSNIVVVETQSASAGSGPIRRTMVDTTGRPCGDRSSVRDTDSGG